MDLSKSIAVAIGGIMALSSCAPPTNFVTKTPAFFLDQEPIEIITLQRTEAPLPRTTNNQDGVELGLAQTIDSLREHLPGNTGIGLTISAQKQWLSFTFASEGTLAPREVTFDCQIVSETLGSPESAYKIVVRHVTASGPPLSSKSDVFVHWNYIAPWFEKGAQNLGSSNPYSIAVAVPKSGA